MFKKIMELLGFNQQEEVASKKKIAVIVGHEAAKKGAKIYTGEREYDYNSRIADKLLAAYKGNCDIKIFKRDKIGISGVAKQVAEWGAEMSLELHLNASGMASARGAEFLVISGDKDSEVKASSMAQHLQKYMGLKLRHEGGLKKLKRGERGYKNLESCKSAGVKQVILIEPFFCDFKTPESEIFIKHEWKYVQYLIDCLQE